MKKIFTTSFISGLGRHSTKSFGKDLGLDKVMKAAKSKGLPIDNFKVVNNFVTNAETAMKLLNVGGKLAASIIDNGDNSLLHNKNNKLALTSSSSCSTNTKNNALYLRTKVNLGKPSAEFILHVKKGPFMDTLNKTIVSTDSDYIEHEKRKNLWLESGFNQKGHCFLMEDTYFTVGDYMKMYKVEKRFKEELSVKHKGTRNIYGCALDTKHVIKLKSRLEFYDIKVIIHLVKITDIGTDLRQLIKEFTNNSEQQTYISSGAIPKDEQLSEPIFVKDNKATLSFLTLPNTNLRTVNRFTEKARIVKSWKRTLTPGSMWEFDLDHHLGEGIHINYMNDMSNKQHPSGYVFYIEFLGDKRATVKRISSGDVFAGHSPCKLLLDFTKEIRYVAHQNDEEDLAVKKIIKNEQDFEEDSDFFEVFHKDRQPKFNLNYTDLIAGTGVKKEYFLEQDQFNLTGIEVQSLFKNIKQEFVNNGLEETDANEDDIRLNLKKDPDESESTDSAKFVFLRGSDEPKEQNMEENSNE